MSIVKIKHPKLKKGETKNVTLEHADRIFNMQRDNGTAKESCWELVKETAKKTS